MNNSNYYSKYLKYKNKYLNLKKNLSGSGRRFPIEDNSVHLSLPFSKKKSLTKKQRDALNGLLNNYNFVTSVSIIYIDEVNGRVNVPLDLKKSEYLPYPNSSIMSEFLRTGPWDSKIFYIKINLKNRLKITVTNSNPSKKIVWEINSLARPTFFDEISNLMDCILFKDSSGQLFIPYNNQIRALNKFKRERIKEHHTILLNPFNTQTSKSEIEVKLGKHGQKLVIKQNDKITLFFEGKSGIRFEILNYKNYSPYTTKFIIGNVLPNLRPNCYKEIANTLKYGKDSRGSKYWIDREKEYKTEERLGGTKRTYTIFSSSNYPNFMFYEIYDEYKPTDARVYDSVLAYRDFGDKTVAGLIPPIGSSIKALDVFNDGLEGECI